MQRRIGLPRLGIGLVLLSLLLAACNLPTATGPGPRAWIDYPSNGMSFSSGTIVVVSHSTGPQAIGPVSLFVNGAEERTDVNPDSSQSLVALSHPWVPPGPGVYTLEVRVRDESGNEARSLPVRVEIRACATPVGGGAPPAECPPAVLPEVLAGITPPPGEGIPEAPTCTEPTATFPINANCREGPGLDYPIRGTMLAGDSAEIVGKNEDGSWLMVRSSSGACWVAASILEACGDLAGVPLIHAAPPPQAPLAEPPPNQPPAPSQPAAPGGLSVSEHVCQGTTYSVTLSWADTANNEAGYRVYRNGALLANLGAGATGYTDHPPQGGPYSYRVEAFNDAGTASADANDLGCLL